MVIDPRNDSERQVPLPVIDVRSATDNRVYTVVAQAQFDGFRYPYSSYSTVAEDSSYTAFNSANRLNQTKNIGQVAKIVWRHNLTNSTFYTVRLGLVAFDTRSDVQGKDPWEYNHGGIRNPGLFFGQQRIYQAGTDYYTDPLSAYFVTTSDNFTYQEEYSRTYSLGFELVSNRWDGHLVETGFGVRYNDLERYAPDPAGHHAPEPLHRRVDPGPEPQRLPHLQPRGLLVRPGPLGVRGHGGELRPALGHVLPGQRGGHRPGQRGRGRQRGEVQDRVPAAPRLRLPHHRARRLPLPLRPLRAVPRAASTCSPARIPSATRASWATRTCSR